MATILVVVHLFCVVHEFFFVNDDDDDEHCVHWKFSVFVATDCIPGLNGWMKYSCARIIPNKCHDCTNDGILWT